MCIALLVSAQSQSSAGELGPVDTYFVTQTSLGTPFQVESGNLAVTKGTTQAIRDYAQLMVSSHVAVNNALDAILRKMPAAPPPTLLKAAYSTVIFDP
jgi:putative membrane protein